MITSLSVFDQPVKEALKSHVKKIGHAPSELEPIISAAVEQAKGLLPDTARSLSPTILRERIKSDAKVYVEGVLCQNREWQECRERIRAYSSIFLAGAGLSYGSDMPLANILDDVLTFYRVSSWDELRKDANKCLAFKKQFGEICNDKQPSNAHKLIMLNFPSHILEIICLNWDNLLEEAAKQMKKSIHKQNEEQPATTERYLWKFHGDVENIKADNVMGNGGWVFPDEKGYVFSSFKEYIKQTNLEGQLFTFVIVGYSEKETVIYDEIVALLEKEPPRPTYRIGLELKNLHKNRYIVGTAEFTLKKILPVTR